MPVIPAPRKAEMGRLLEPRGSRPTWATVVVRPMSLKKKKRERRKKEKKNVMLELSEFCMLDTEQDIKY